MKLSKKKKILLLGTSVGIVTTTIVTPIVVLNNKNSIQNKINVFKQKIIDRDILIAPNVSTNNQSEIQSEIKNQLKKENPLLTDNDLLKISINLSTLDIGIKTKVILIINIDSRTSTLKIDVEKANLLKNSKIFDGHYGTIFQDSFKNLWAMGDRKKLQVLKANENGDGYVSYWTNNNKNGEALLKGSEINDSIGGKIFQDEFKNLWAMGNNSKLQVLRANSSKNGYVKTGWNSDNSNLAIGLLKGSNINDGFHGTILQDKFKNLWTLTINKKLQVLRVNDDGDGYDEITGWTSANSGLTKNSNIANGEAGTIFQDQFKNLWAMGFLPKLQVLRVNDDGDGYDEITGWTSANSGLTKNSNIKFGLYGAIFQDEFKNLWAMGHRPKLQVLKANTNKDGYVTTGWINDNSSSDDKLLRGSNIINRSTRGAIFQDSFKNLWTTTWKQKLQVLKANTNKDGYVNTGWTSANSGLTKGSNITNGRNSKIFQDKFKNLWTMGYKSKLQVLKANKNGNGYVTTGWIDNNKDGEILLKNSSINDGFGGTIFQDDFKNLWAMSEKTKLQVLKVNQNGNGYVDSWQKHSD